MKPEAYVSHYLYQGIRLGEDVLTEIPLARRFTRLQAAALLAVARLQASTPDLWADFARHPQSLFYMATQYGELATIVSLQKALLDGMFPLSPTAFQNSLPSSALGYGAIVHRLTQPHMTFSSGFLSLDRMLHWAHFKVVNGIAPFVLCLNVNEIITSQTEVIAESELIMLGSAPSQGYRLSHITFGSDHCKEGSGVLVEEGPGLLNMLRLDGQMGASFSRSARSHDGLVFESGWDKICN